MSPFSYAVKHPHVDVAEDMPILHLHDYVDFHSHARNTNSGQWNGMS